MEAPKQNMLKETFLACNPFKRGSWVNVQGYSFIVSFEGLLEAHRSESNPVFHKKKAKVRYISGEITRILGNMNVFFSFFSPVIIV